MLEIQPVQSEVIQEGISYTQIYSMEEINNPNLTSEVRTKMVAENEENLKRIAKFDSISAQSEKYKTEPYSTTGYTEENLQDMLTLNNQISAKTTNATELTTVTSNSDTTNETVD